MDNLKPACRVTHTQIAEGTCHWCRMQLPNKTDAVVVAMGRSGRCTWDVDALSAAICHADSEMRSMAVSNLMSDDGSSLEVSAPLLSTAMDDKDELNRHLAESALQRLGRDLTREDVQRIELMLEGSFQETSLRIALLGYYFLGQFESSSASEIRFQHLLWLINHAPRTHTAGSPEVCVLKREDAERYTAASNLWLKQVDRHPTDTAIIGNAASFFVLNERELGERLYKKAQNLDPDNPTWSERLAQLYALSSKSDSTNSERNARFALKEFVAAETARKAMSEKGDSESHELKDAKEVTRKAHALPEMAKAAIAAGQLEDARRYASELLALTQSDETSKYFRRNGNAIHYANLVLGQCALRDGDVEAAKEHLLASGRTDGSPNLKSFGPNMSLARELLEQNEVEVVLEYFHLCRDFWKSGGEKLEQWTEQVRQGEIPDFGANLVY